MHILPGDLLTDWTSGELHGSGVVSDDRTLADLQGLFFDEAARQQMAQDRVIYRTECVFPVPGGTPGGLFWGTTFIEPGDVAGEYFMTKGHFHAQPDRTEAYFTFTGEGVLLLMDRERNCRAEQMRPGSTHLIPADTAHRTINVGSATLAFGACWPSDAGHDYAAIAGAGFSARVMRGPDGPELVPA